MTAPLSAPGTKNDEVLVTWPDYDLDAHGLGGALAEAGLEIRLEPKRGRRDPAEMRGIAARAAAAIVSTDPFDAEILDACPALRVIARVGIGVDSIDLEAATRRGVAVTVTPGANEETVADHTLAVMLAAGRRGWGGGPGGPPPPPEPPPTPPPPAPTRAPPRPRPPPHTGPHTPWTLSGSTVGLVGYGKIGRAVEQRLQGFGVDLLIADPALDGADPRAVGLGDLLREADVVSLHVPLLPETFHLIGAPEL